jgi:hypothetical protein
MNTPLSFRMRVPSRRFGARSPDSITMTGAEAHMFVVMDSGLAASPRPGMTRGIA